MLTDEAHTDKAKVCFMPSLASQPALLKCIKVKLISQRIYVLYISLYILTSEPRNVPRTVAQTNRIILG